MTPYEAIKAGADYIVVGRPIRLAADPVDAARKVVAEIEQGMARPVLSVAFIFVPKCNLGTKIIISAYIS